MIDRELIRRGALIWAASGAAVGFASLRTVNADARLLVIAACIVGSGAAVMASRAIGAQHVRRAGWLLLLSVVTPTFFFWILNVPALAVGLLLVIAPHVVTERSVGATSGLR